jgi:ATP-dependent DNA ligase
MMLLACRLLFRKLRFQTIADTRAHVLFWSRDSRYEPGQRSGAWRKMRVNQGQEFVIAGYTPGPRNFDAVIIGHYEGDRLIYVARTRNGFTPASREALFRRFKGLEVAQCPFANLPEAKSGMWGVGLTAEKMLECRWCRRWWGTLNSWK